MIDIVEGNLLDAKEDIIVHQVNCMGVMGSGIAKQIKEKWFKVFTDYKRFTLGLEGDNRLLGRVQFVETEEGGKVVANLFGQLSYGNMKMRYTSYDALAEGLSFIATNARNYKKSVAFPVGMSSDRGGADWEIVLKMIEVYFKDIDVTLYKYNGGK